MKHARQEILKRIRDAKTRVGAKKVHLCAVTKRRSIEEVEALLEDLPEINSIGENRWPDCVEVFTNFTKIEKHFIGPLQKNKVRKVVELVDVIQSVDSIKLLEKINSAAREYGKKIKFCFQVNISQDPAKSGVQTEKLEKLIEQYQEASLKNVILIGLMTIGAEVSLEERRTYFDAMKKLFDECNMRYFQDKPLQVLSMGMSDDFEEAIAAGSTMVRLGRCLFEEKTALNLHS